MFGYFDFSKVLRGKNTAHKAMWAHSSQRSQSALMLPFFMCVVHLTRKPLNWLGDVFLPQVLMLTSVRRRYFIFLFVLFENIGELASEASARERKIHPPLPPCTGGQ